MAMPVQLNVLPWSLINIIKDELSVTFVSLGIIIYPTILGVNLHFSFEI
jgi:hypothetical protein